MTMEDLYSGDLRTGVSHELDLTHENFEKLFREVRRLRSQIDAFASGNLIRATAIQGVLPAANGGSAAAGNTLGSVSMWKNAAGATRVQGDVIVENGDRTFGTTTTVSNPLVIGVLDDASVIVGADGRIRHEGYQAVLNVFNAVAAGDYLRSSATAGAAESAGTVAAIGVFAIALTTKAGAGAGIVTAYVFPAERFPLIDVSDISLIATIATIDATQTTLQTIAAPATTTMSLESRVVARRTGGTAGTAEDAASYLIYATVKNIAGTATIVGGVVALMVNEDQVLWDATIDVNGGNARVRVTGAVLNNVDWKCSTRVLQVS